MKHMAKDVKQIQLEYEEVTGKTLSDDGVFRLIQLSYEFYAKTICSAIRRYFNENSTDDPYSIEFYEKPLRSINKGRRSKEAWGDMTEEKKSIIRLVSGFVVTDWGAKEAKTLQEMCNTAQIQEVKEGIKDAQEAQVYSISYLKAIVDSKIGLRLMQKESRRRIKEDNQAKLADATKTCHKRSTIEMASLMADWADTIDGLETEKKLKDLRGEI
jgi:hypothetical protein